MCISAETTAKTKSLQLRIQYPPINLVTVVTRIYRFIHMIALVTFQVTQLHLFFNEWIVGTIYMLLPKFPLKASIFNFSRGALVNISFYFPLPLLRPPRFLHMLPQDLLLPYGTGLRFAG